MAKNIIIYSDGTGQVGGLRPDETSTSSTAPRAADPTPTSTRGNNLLSTTPGSGRGLRGGAFFATRA